MGTYPIPRNYRGESRILYIFTMKSLITTAIGAMVGSIFFLLFKAFGMTLVGIIITAFFCTYRICSWSNKNSYDSSISNNKKDWWGTNWRNYFKIYKI